MLSHIGAAIVLALVGVLGISAVVLSIVILRRGKFYHRLKPESRPRRWVLFSLLVLVGVFVVWFPTWMIWPRALISRILSGMFAVTFFVVGITYKWLWRPVDSYITRKGWQLR
jgi:hypothetical protein